MTQFAATPSAGALDEVRRLAGPSAVIVDVARLPGGQHADTWRVDTATPAFSAVVRQFPIGDAGARHEQRVLQTLDGLQGLAPVLLGQDLDGRWSPHPTTVISRLDGEPDITPSDPLSWARELGHALALVHGVSGDRLAGLPSVFDGRGSQAELSGPLTAKVRSRWSQIVESPERLSHCDYWSGNVVWRGGRLAGIVDWSGAACGPRGYDLAWCRLDLLLLFDERIADVFLAAYEPRSARPLATRYLGRVGRRSFARHGRDVDCELRAPGTRRPQRTRASPAPFAVDDAPVGTKLKPERSDRQPASRARRVTGGQSRALRWASSLNDHIGLRGRRWAPSRRSLATRSSSAARPAPSAWPSRQRARWGRFFYACTGPGRGGRSRSDGAAWPASPAPAPSSPSPRPFARSRPAMSGTTSSTCPSWSSWRAS